MGTGRTVDKNGIQEAPTLPCPALALSSHPLWTVHSHIVEEPPKHKRTDWGNLLEIFCFIISNGLSTSRLTLASLFLEKTRFSPSGNMHYISEHLSLSTISSDASVCLAVEGKWGGRCLDFDLAHHPSQRCGWNMVVGFGDPSQPPPPNTPIWSSYTEALEKKPGDSQKYRVRISLIAGKEPACQALLFYKCVDRFLAL